MMTTPPCLHSAWDCGITVLTLLGALHTGAALAQAKQDTAAISIFEGFRLMTERTSGNCVACHALPGQTGGQSSFGPALSGAGQRYTADELRQWVTDARRIKPNTLMPPFGSMEGLNRPNPPQPVLTAAQISDVVAALQSLR